MTDPMAIFVLCAMGFILFFVLVLYFVSKRAPSKENDAFAATVIGASLGGGMGAATAAAAFAKKPRPKDDGDDDE